MEKILLCNHAQIVNIFAVRVNVSYEELAKDLELPQIQSIQHIQVYSLLMSDKEWIYAVDKRARFRTRKNMST